MRLNGLMSNVKWRDEAAVGVGLLPWASYMFKNHEAQWPHMSNVKLCAGGAHAVHGICLPAAFGSPR
jgi:hypothetical protein